MKFHFIYPDIGTGFYPSVHHGLAQLVAVLKTGGHEVSLHHVKKEPRREEIVSTVLNELPDFVGFTVMSNQAHYVEEWSLWIKVHGIPVVCGGVHATLNPEEVLGYKGVDIVCVGDGDKTVLDLAMIKRDEIKFTIGSSMVDNLDELPFPDYSLFDCESMLKARNGNFAVICSRGCPMSCNYCCNQALRERQEGSGKYFRFRSVDNTLAMLESYVAQYPIRSFSFADDIFGLNKKWVYEFCEKYPKAIGLPFDCNLRVESVTKELLEALKSANCTMIEMGIESGNSWMRREVLNRKMSNQEIVDAFEYAHRLGIKTRAYNMIGLPYETPSMARETLELNKLVEPDEVAVFYFYPYKGTKLYDVCEKEGFLTDKQFAGYVAESVLKLPTISARELKRIHNEFYRYAIERQIKTYGAGVRLGFRVVYGLLRVLTWGNEVDVMRVVYMRMFPLFQGLRNR